MPRTTISHQNQLGSYQRLIRRINRTITTPHAQRERQANLYPRQAERPEDWERLLDEIQQTDGVALMKRPDGSVYVTWRQADI